MPFHSVLAMLYFITVASHAGDREDVNPQSRPKAARFLCVFYPTELLTHIHDPFQSRNAIITE